MSMGKQQSLKEPLEVMAKDRGMGRIGPFALQDASGVIIAENISNPDIAEALAQSVNDYDTLQQRNAALVEALTEVAATEYHSNDYSCGVSPKHSYSQARDIAKAALAANGGGDRKNAQLDEALEEERNRKGDV